MITYQDQVVAAGCQFNAKEAGQKEDESTHTGIRLHGAESNQEAATSG